MENKKVLIEDLCEDQLAQEIGQASLSDKQNNKTKQINNSSSFFPHNTQKTPWLVYFADGEQDETHTFYSLEQNEFHLKNTIRQLDRRAVLKYSPYGWLITEDLHTKQLILLNPISMEEIIIPPPPLLPQAKEYEWCHITAPPTDRDCLLFIATDDCPFMRVYSLSEKTWHVWELDIEEEAGLMYVVVFNEYILGIAERQRLVRVIFDGCKPVVKYLDMKLVHHPFAKCAANYSWVASGDELFLVQTIHILWTENIEGLSVSKMNFDEMRWEVVNDIGDRMFFLSFGSEGVSCNASETGLKRNCAYYISGDGYFYEYNVASRGVRMLRPFEHIGNEFWVLPKMDGHIGSDQSLEKSVREDCEKIGRKCYLDNTLVASTRLSRLETKEQMMEEKPLTNLYSDLVGLILHRLSYIDTRYVADVIPSWLPIINETPKPLDNWCIGSPCLLSFSNDFRTCCLIDHLRNKRHIIRSPELPYRIKILSSKHGWLLLLATLDSFMETNDSMKLISDFYIFFYNPLSKAIIKLPPYKPDEFIGNYSFSFSSPPTCSNCVVVAERIEGFAKISMCRKGDSEWTKFVDHEDENDISTNIFASPIFLKGEFHMLMDDGRIGLFNPVALSWRVYGDSKTINPKTHRHHLVESNDELFWICATKNGDSIRVCKLDRSDYCWKETECLGGKCFFVGQYSSVSASNLEGEKDMVYFPMFQDGRLVGYSCAEQKLFCGRDFYGFEELTLGSCWIEPRWTQYNDEDLQWF
ncbi:hypothetical protein LUZ60_004246 [Juncus effusus]|nr:hypothetical protein LUZ60_004246 [Juncus effusus]